MMEDKNAKMFIGDKEVGNVRSWGLSSFPVEEADYLPLYDTIETITFNGTYDPIGDEDWKAFSKWFDEIQSKAGNEFVGIIRSFSGETRQAKLRVVKLADGLISLEPVEEEVKEWIKGWM